MMDVSERRAAAERALNDALHDPLTRLPNRALFLDLVRRTFARTRRREDQSFAVVFLDLDRFKAVNDSLGHAAGDDLLVQFARRLQTCLREGDTLARHGGDEFTILLDDVKGPADAISAAQRIHDVTAQAFQVTGHEVFSTASIGIAIWAPSYARAEDLLHDADTAMYRAKAQGRARTVVFDATMREREPQLLELEADLRRALVRDEFRVHYLPVVDVASGRIQGLEALIRWAHPKRGLVQPEHFVPFAEETGLIVPIGSWLLRQAGRDFLGWRRAASSAERLSLHVNVSPKQLQNGALLEQLEGLFQDSELDPRDLALDVTERAIEDDGDTAARLTQIRHRGVRLCIDDFGSGHASIAALHRLQLDALKIDRSLFTGGSPRGSSPDLVRSIVSLARALGKPVVAEGVETADQFHFVRELGCSAAQGFYFSPPVDSSATSSLLERAPIW
jgi:diguanylate cyclase (GGDEF)-like protein